MRTALVAGALLLTGCSGNTPPPTVAQVDTDVCIVAGIAACVAGKTPIQECISTIAQRCGTSPAAATKMWEAHIKAEVLEGFVPRPSFVLEGR